MGLLRSWKTRLPLNSRVSPRHDRIRTMRGAVRWSRTPALESLSHCVWSTENRACDTSLCNMMCENRFTPARRSTKQTRTLFANRSLIVFVHLYPFQYHRRQIKQNFRLNTYWCRLTIPVNRWNCDRYGCFVNRGRYSRIVFKHSLRSPSVLY